MTNRTSFAPAARLATTTWFTVLAIALCLFAAPAYAQANTTPLASATDRGLSTQAERSSAGRSYAVLTDAGELVFFRSTASYTAGPDQTVTDIMGNTYTGEVYTRVESTVSGSVSLYQWASRAADVKSARIAEGQALKLRTCNSLFTNCTNMTSCDLDGLDTSSAKDFAYMFSFCRSLLELDVSGFDTSNATNLSCMFQRCEKIERLDVSGFDTSKVTDLSKTFAICEKLKSIDVSHFDVSHVESMDYLFTECQSLTSLDVSGFDTSNVKTAAFMFQGCSSLERLELGSADFRNATTIQGMFFRCPKLPSIDVSHFSTSNVTNMSQLFWGCSSLTSLDLTNFDTRNVTNMSFMFYECPALTDVDVSGFDTAKVVDMQRMFGKCGALAHVDVSSFDTSSVESFYEMFKECRSMTELDVCGFRTGSATTMYGMFQSCNAVRALDVGNFDTSNVTNFRFMFMGCMSLDELDVSRFDTSKAKNMGYMIASCSSLKELDISSFDMSSSENSKYMLVGLEHLEKISLGAGNVLRDTWLDRSQEGHSWAKGSADSRTRYASEELCASYDGTSMADTYFWSPNVFIVAFDANGGGGNMAPKSVAYGQGVNVAQSSFTRAGYEFSNWNDKPDGSGQNYAAGSSITSVSSDVILYAQWQPVQLDMSMPTRIAYALAPDGTLTGPRDGSVRISNDGITGIAVTGLAVRAQEGFAIAPENDPGHDSYHLTIRPNDGHIENLGTFCSQSPKAPAHPDEWTIGPAGSLALNALGGTAGPATSCSPSAETIGAIQWRVTMREHRVAYDANGAEGSMQAHDCPNGLSFCAPECLFTHGKRFACWNTAADGSGTSYAPGSTIVVNDDITLHALWR